MKTKTGVVVTSWLQAATDSVVLFVASSPKDKRIQTFLGFAI